MATISSIVSELSGVRDRIDRSVRIAITRGGADISSRLRTGSPVKTGELRYGWRLGRAKSSSGVLASISITNSVSHAAAIEYGIDPGSPTHPWALSLRKDKKDTKKPSIVLKGGRIWSSSAVGGVSNRVISPATVRGLAKGVADSIIAALGKK